MKNTEIKPKIEVKAFNAEKPPGDNAIDSTVTHFASEKVLSKNWLSDEEYSAWQDL